MLLLQNVSFEIRGGELMAIMATTELEGTGLLNVLAGHRGHIGGDLILNGQNINKHVLKSRVAYVQCDSHLCEDMTAQQMLRFHYELKKPTDKLGHLKIDATDRVSKVFYLFILNFLTSIFSERELITEVPAAQGTSVISSGIPSIW